MAALGKSVRSLRRSDLASQRSAGVATLKICFAHKATAGDAGISILALASPTAEMPNFSNPSLPTLAGANLRVYRNNLQLVSSSRGAMQQGLDYEVTSSSYIAFRGFVAQADEIFTGTIDSVPTTNPVVVDVTPIIATGTLAAGQTDINVGTPFAINKYPTKQLGAVMVFLQGYGMPLMRNSGNATAAPGADGNYQEVDAGNGLGSIIRLNDSDTENARSYLVVSTFGYAERPTGSMMAAIENVQTQIDAMVPTLAEVAGVATTVFQPNGFNQNDLRTFAGRVLALEQGSGVKTVKTANYQAAIGEEVYASTASGTWTLTLPASPFVGAKVYVIDAFRTFPANKLNLDPNGQTIEGSTSEFLDVGDSTLRFVGGAIGWRIG